MLSRLSNQLLKKSNKAYFSLLNNPFDDSNYKFTHNLKFLEDLGTLDTFRIIGLNGEILNKNLDDKLDKELLLKVFEVMVRTEAIDEIMLKAQRQGKISFYISSFGETATTVGVPAGLKPEDVIFTQYREQGTFFYRGFSLAEMTAQCSGSTEDTHEHGRRAPVCYSASRLNIQCVSPPLATQIPQASGMGYGFALGKEDRICVGYTGDGAASEGDFHAALNFAATLGSQTLFVARNNRYAISTPSTDQYHTDCLSTRGLGYGMKTIKVDGNDALAVIQATEYAREYILRETAPVFMECMTYRISDHSTSDYSPLYRQLDEISSWKKNNDPISRLAKYLRLKGWLHLDDKGIEDMRAKIEKEVIEAVNYQSNIKRPHIDWLFEDVYDRVMPHLEEQRALLHEVVEKYPDLIDVSRYDDKK